MNWLFKHSAKIVLYIWIALFFVALGYSWRMYQELQSTPSYRYPTLQERPADYQIRFNNARLKYGLENTLHIFGNQFRNERGEVCTFKLRSNP